jgi:hypothetical protein
VRRYLTPFKCRVAKLFAKHMKTEEQAKQLAGNYLPIAVGTPARVKKLLELKDTAPEMMDLLQFHFIPLFNKEDSKLKLVLF